MAERIAYIARIAEGTEGHNTLAPEPGVCFVLAELRDDTTDQVLAGLPYTLRGLESGLTISSTSSEEGLVSHRALPDDHFEIECGGVTEVVVVYYMDDDEHEGEPWTLRMRSS